MLVLTNGLPKESPLSLSLFLDILRKTEWLLYSSIKYYSINEINFRTGILFGMDQWMSHV